MSSSPFPRFAKRTSEIVGKPWAFALAVATVAAWGISGPIFRYSDTWQLTINTGTTIVTFLIVFLIQNTQNREALATQLKLDELIRSAARARTSLVALEELGDDELQALHDEFHELHQRAARHLEKRHAARRHRSGHGSPNQV